MCVCVCVYFVAQKSKKEADVRELDEQIQVENTRVCQLKEELEEANSKNQDQKLNCIDNERPWAPASSLSSSLTCRNIKPKLISTWPLEIRLACI